MTCSMIPRTHRAPTEITLIFCTEFYYHANISTNGNTRSLEKFLYEILYHPEFVQFDLDRKIMRHLLDPTIRTFDQSACRRGEFLCAGTRVRLYPNIKKILYFISSRAFWAYTILRVKSESLHWCDKKNSTGPRGTEFVHCFSHQLQQLLGAWSLIFPWIFLLSQQIWCRILLFILCWPIH